MDVFIFLCACLAVYAFFGRRFPVRPYLPLANKQALLGLTTAFFCGSLFVSTTLIVDVAYRHYRLPANVSIEVILNSMALSTDNLLRLTRALMVVVLAEEVFFRGVLFGVARRFVSNSWALWIQALMFACAHIYVYSNSPIHIVGTLVVGLSLGVLTLHCVGGLWAAFGFHLAINLGGIWAYRFIGDTAHPEIVPLFSEKVAPNSSTELLLANDMQLVIVSHIVLALVLLHMHYKVNRVSSEQA